jgi:hypothetical protein
VLCSGDEINSDIEQFCVCVMDINSTKGSGVVHVAVAVVCQLCTWPVYCFRGSSMGLVPTFL